MEPIITDGKRACMIRSKAGDKVLNVVIVPSVITFNTFNTLC